MKVLLTTDRYYPAVSGVITSVMNLAKELEKRGHEVKILTLSETVHSYVSGSVIYIGSFDAGAIYPDVRLKHLVSRKDINAIIDWKPDIIHSNCEFSTFFLAKKIASAAKIPMVHTYHTDYEDYVHYVALSKNMGFHIVKRYVTYVSSYMKRIICPTVKTANILRKYKIKTPIDIIPTGLDLERFASDLPMEKKAGLLSKYGIGADEKVVIYIGRIGKEKNIGEILGFLKSMDRRDFKFLIVGDGPDREDLQKKVKESGIEDIVRFTGMIPQAEVASYYKLGTVFVSASQSETQGLTYIEALSSGIPLICRRDDCLKNVILQGENGWQYEEENEFKAHLNTILDMGSDEYNKMCAFARENAFSSFSSSVFCDQVEECYEKAMRIPIRSTFFKDIYYRISRKFPFI
jgi:Glycosyltransferase